MNHSRAIVLAASVVLLAASLLVGCRSAHTTSAILYIEQEQYQKAVDVIDEGLQYNPEDPEGFYYQGEAYSRMAQQAIDENDYLDAKHSFEAAYEKYTTAREMDPENWSEQVAEALEINYINTKREAQKHWSERHFEEAEGFFRLAYAALPDSLESIKNIAGMKIQQAELAAGDDREDDAREFRLEALDLLEQVLAENPEAYRLRADKAYVLTQLGRTDAAQGIYDELLRTHGDDPDLLLDVVGLYSKQQRFDDAGDLFMKVADIYKNDDDFQNDAKLKGMYQEAGYNYQLAENYLKAIEAYDLANERDLNDEMIMVQRVQLNLQYGQSLIIEAAGLAESDPERSAELEAEARTYLQRAVDVGNALVDIAPDNADGYYFLAQAQGALGDETAFNENMKRYEELTGTQ
jgi:tetratricopeptide (TPR) repeat protein